MMDRKDVLASLQEDVKRYTDLSVMSQEEFIRNGCKYKADTYRAAIELIERESVDDGR